MSAKVGSLKYAAMKIGCSLPTLYDLIQRGKLRSYHIGRAHRASEQAVADCIALLAASHGKRAVSPSTVPDTSRDASTSRAVLAGPITRGGVAHRRAAHQPGILPKRCNSPLSFTHGCALSQ